MAFPIRLSKVLQLLFNGGVIALLMTSFTLCCLCTTATAAPSGAIKADPSRALPTNPESAANILKPPSGCGLHPVSPSLAQLSFPVLEEDFLDEEAQPEEIEKPIEPITRMVPIWGEKVREKGFDLPLPFGIGANLVFMDQGIKLRNVKVGIGDPTVEIRGPAFSDARAHDRANTARLDVWLLPFANIYGIFGYINGETELDVDVGRITGGFHSRFPHLKRGKPSI